MIKKLAAVTAALTIAICSFTSCSKNNDSSSTVSSTVDSSVSAVDSTTEKQTPEPSLTIDGKSIDTKDFIVCTIDGKDIDFDTFRYYYYYTISKYTSTYGATLDTIKSTDGGFKLLMEDVITALKQELVAPELAEENGIKLTDDDNKTIDDQIAKAKANYDSDEAYLNDIKSAYLTEDLYRKMLAGLNNKIGKEEIKSSMKQVGLDPDLKRHVRKYSLGMRQRLGLAQAIMENPKILILDEPFNGLDKDGVKEMREYLLSYKEQGKTILICSHSAEDISVLCDTVHEMDKGVISEIKG